MSSFGPTPKEERRDFDWYPTPEPLTLALLERWSVSKDLVIAEPSAGDGAISRVLERAGYQVVTGDIDPRWTHVDFPEVDFLHPDALEIYAGVDVIVGNPPYGIAAEYIAQALRITPHVVQLLPLNWLEPCKNRVNIAGLPGWAHIFQRCSHTDFTGGGGDSKTVMWRVWDDCYEDFRISNILSGELERLAGQQALL